MAYRFTTDQKRDALALGDLMERVKQFPDGVEFVTDLFLLAIQKQGLLVVDRAKYEAGQRALERMIVQ